VEKGDCDKPRHPPAPASAWLNGRRLA
jgi:hypothetical protein